jgi:hypothetical protein
LSGTPVIRVVDDNFEELLLHLSQREEDLDSLEGGCFSDTCILATTNSFERTPLTNGTHLGDIPATSECCGLRFNDSIPPFLNCEVTGISLTPEEFSSAIRPFNQNIAFRFCTSSCRRWIFGIFVICLIIAIAALAIAFFQNATFGLHPLFSYILLSALVVILLLCLLSCLLTYKCCSNSAVKEANKILMHKNLLVGHRAGQLKFYCYDLQACCESCQEDNSESALISDYIVARFFIPYIRHLLNESLPSPKEILHCDKGMCLCQYIELYQRTKCCYCQCI